MSNWLFDLKAKAFEEKSSKIAEREANIIFLTSKSFCNKKEAPSDDAVADGGALYE